MEYNKVRASGDVAILKSPFNLLSSHSCKKDNDILNQLFFIKLKR